MYMCLCCGETFDLDERRHDAMCPECGYAAVLVGTYIEEDEWTN